jgi:CheY-like chemotaxis protein
LIFPSALAGVDLLIVDDERDARDAVGAVLEAAGATVRLAASVDEALTVIRAGAVPDVIVSDIAMPDSDGFALIRELRGREEHGGHRFRVLALTAYAGEHESERIERAGFDDHLAKPIEAGHLVSAVSRLVGAAPD